MCLESDIVPCFRCDLHDCISLMLLIAIVVVCITNQGLERKLAMSASTNYEFEMSTDHNYIILLVDSVDGKRMSEIREIGLKMWCRIWASLNP